MLTAGSTFQSASLQLRPFFPTPETSGKIKNWLLCTQCLTQNSECLLQQERKIQLLEVRRRGRHCSVLGLFRGPIPAFRHCRVRCQSIWNSIWTLAGALPPVVRLGFAQEMKQRECSSEIRNHSSFMGLAVVTAITGTTKKQ